MNILAFILRDRTLRVVVTTMILVGAIVASIAPYRSLLAIQYFRLSNAEFAVVLGCGGVTDIATSLYIGIITDQGANRKRVAIATASCFVAGSVLVWWWPVAAAFIISHALILPVASSLQVQCFSITHIAALEQEEHIRYGLLASTRAFIAIPFIAVLPLWSLAVQKGIPLIDIYPVMATLASLCLFIVIVGWPTALAGTQAANEPDLSFFNSIKAIVSTEVLYRMGLIAMISAGPTLYMVLIGLVFSQSPGRAKADLGIFVAIVSIMEIIIMFATSWLLRHMSKVLLIAGAAGIYACFFCSFVRMANGHWIWALTVPAAAGAGIIVSIPIAYMQDVVVNRPGVGGSLMTLVKVLSNFIASTVFALGTNMGGYSCAALLGAIVVASGGGVLYWLDRRTSRVPHAGT